MRVGQGRTRSGRPQGLTLTRSHDAVRLRQGVNDMHLMAFTPSRNWRFENRRCTSNEKPPALVTRKGSSMPRATSRASLDARALPPSAIDTSWHLLPAFAQWRTRDVVPLDRGNGAERVASLRFTAIALSHLGRALLPPAVEVGHASATARPNPSLKRRPSTAGCFARATEVVHCRSPGQSSRPLRAP